MSRFAIDTLVALYAVGGPSPYRAGCRRLVDRIGDGVLVAEAGANVIHEYVSVRGRHTGDWAGALVEGARWLDLLVIHPIERRDLDEAGRLAARVAGLDASAALDAAVCLNHEIPTLVSPDGRLDAVTGLRRVDPRDADASLIGGLSR